MSKRVGPTVNTLSVIFVGMVTTSVIFALSVVAAFALLIKVLLFG
jgi:hypothetical protein